MNLKNTCISACVLGFGLVVLGGCEASVAAGPSTTTTTSVAVVGNDQAIQSLTSARCGRDNSCNNIGEGKKYDSMDACTREVGHDTGITLRAEKCPNGIIAERLDSCLNEIRTERCGNPIDSLERVAACRKAMLCR